MAYFRCGGGGGININSLPTAKLSKCNLYTPESANNCSNMFRDNDAYNSITVIGSNVTNCSNMFKNASNFNSYVFFMGSKINDFSSMFEYSNYNSGKTFLYVDGDISNVFNMDSIFKDTPYANSFIIISKNDTNIDTIKMSKAFYNCNFSSLPFSFQQYNFSLNLSYAFYNTKMMFYSVYNIIKENVSNAQGMFENCNDLLFPLAYFEQNDVELDFPTTFQPESFNRMLANCGHAYQETEWVNNLIVNFTNYINQTINFDYMFSGSNVKNVEIRLLNTKNYNLHMNGLVSNNPDFNSNIVFNFTTATSTPKNAYMSGLFENCTNFNQPFNFNNFGYVYDTSNMFRNCTNFDQKIEFNGVHLFSNCQYMFSGCTKLNKVFNIPVYTNNLYRAFENTNVNVIRLKGTTSTDVSQKNYVCMVANRQKNSSDPTKYNRLNIWCNSSFLSHLNGTTAATSITGTDIVWSNGTNCKYNSAYNINIFYNYSNVANTP